MKNIKLIVCDIDNTLVVKHQPLTRYSKEIIDECHKRGILFGLASGRGTLMLKQLAEDWNIHCDVLIGMNGSEMYDHLLNKEEIFYEMEEDWLKQCIEIMSPFESQPHCLKDGVSYIRENNEAQKASNRYIRNKKPDYIVKDDSDFWKGKSPKISFRVKAEDMPAIEERVSSYTLQGFIGFKTETTMFEFCHQDSSKGNLLKEFCKRHHIAKEEVCSFGDMSNDISLLKESGVAVCMSNGSDDCKAAATHITDYPVSQDGVAHFIETYLFKIVTN
ncbi:MAG: HAD family phosphatase [Erysipelotrichaceae bacterium]|nr:HAD family phosphatase [Erysipelotrichaceae bacterium]